MTLYIHVKQFIYVESRLYFRGPLMPREIDETQIHHLTNAGLSQREIARRLGIPRSTLQDWLKRQAGVPVQRPVQPLGVTN
jgi:predicted XRE-type DNA-binding protein